MNKIYCDVGEVPKNKRRGTMKECAELGQIKYYGERKADAKMIQIVIDKKKRKKSFTDLNKEYVKLTSKLGSIVGKIKRIEKDIPYEKDEKKMKKMEKEKKDLEKELNKIRDLLIPLKEKINKELKKKEEAKPKAKPEPEPKAKPEPEPELEEEPEPEEEEEDDIEQLKRLIDEYSDKIKNLKKENQKPVAIKMLDLLSTEFKKNKYPNELLEKFKETHDLKEDDKIILPYFDIDEIKKINIKKYTKNLAGGNTVFLYNMWFSLFKYKKLNCIIDKPLNSEGFEEYNNFKDEEDEPVIFDSFNRNIILLNGVSQIVLLDAKKGIEQLNIKEIKKTIKECKNKFFIFGCVLTNICHQNILILDLDNKTWERYEPNGINSLNLAIDKQYKEHITNFIKKIGKFEYKSSENSTINNIINLDEIKNHMTKKNFKDLQSELKSEKLGLQSMENYAKIGAEDRAGLCQLWSILYLNLLLANPNVEINNVLKYLFDKINNNPNLLVAYLKYFIMQTNKIYFKNIVDEENKSVISLVEVFDRIKKYFSP